MEPESIMEKEIESAVVQAIAQQKQIDPSVISSDSSLEALGITSLDAITIVYEIEEQFDVEVPNEQLESLRSVSDIVAGIKQLIDAK